MVEIALWREMEFIGNAQQSSAEYLLQMRVFILQHNLPGLRTGPEAQRSNTPSPQDPK
jgi:hypothetical protein